MLAHVQVTADGTPLGGELRSLTPPEDRTVKGLVVYDLLFPFPASVRRPSRLTVHEDLLREITFAPGNPWEATFVARLAREERVVREGVLLTAAQPIDWPLDWDAPPEVAPASLSQARLVREYVEYGIRHILGGWDHLLFVAALVVAVGSILDLLAVVTAFTVAHTVTLTLATLRLASLPRGIVEPMIAASIIAVAAQNLLVPRHSRGWPRLGVAFGFGLFHGLGFAGGLVDAMRDLPAIAIATAIGAFSAGVELGHQLVVLLLFGVLTMLRRIDAQQIGDGRLAPRARRFGSAAVLAGGLYYLAFALR